MQTKSGEVLFYTVREAATELHINPSTLYRAIRENAFPAVRVRSRYIIPAQALQRLISQASETGQLVNPRHMITERRNSKRFESRRRNGNS